MTEFQPHLAAMRFGVGRAPDHPDPASVSEMIATLRGPDVMAQRFPIQGMAGLAEAAQSLRVARRERDQGKITRAAYTDLANLYREAERTRSLQDFAATLARAIATPDGFRDRLTLFWADHFAVEGRDFLMKRRTDGFTEDAIRPHVSGKFSDMLRAAALHPMMVNFLNQDVSVGPNSPYAQRPKTSGRGLNENLAREILELHTLGVQSSYTQTDVRQFAELLAGVGLNGKRETVFLDKRAEPGAEQVLDFSSSAKAARFEDVTDLLDHLAVHPDTARHLSLKLAVHFVADSPDPDLVDAMTARYLETQGDLAAVYETMLNHPAAMAPDLAKVKRPIDFVMSTLRVLGATPDVLTRFAVERPGPILRGILQPMQRMGQPWGSPGGPDGWPETAEAWVTPNSLAERMRWAIRIQTAHGMRPVEPQAVLYQALGPLADQRIEFAVSAAETREEAVALVLMSPAFQRR